MSAKPTSRISQLRLAAERNVSKRPALSAAEKRYREYSAFLRGAEWERRRWLKQQKARDLAYLQPVYR